MIHIAVVVVMIALASIVKSEDTGPTLQTFEATVRLADGRADKVRAQARDFNEAHNAIERVHCGGTHPPSCIVEDLRTVQ